MLYGIVASLACAVAGFLAQEQSDQDLDLMIGM